MSKENLISPEPFQALLLFDVLTGLKFTFIMSDFYFRLALPQCSQCASNMTQNNICMRSRERTVSSRRGGRRGIEHKLSGQCLTRAAVPQLTVQSFY